MGLSSLGKRNSEAGDVASPVRKKANHEGRGAKADDAKEKAASRRPAKQPPPQCKAQNDQCQGDVTDLDGTKLCALHSEVYDKFFSYITAEKFCSLLKNNPKFRTNVASSITVLRQEDNTSKAELEVENSEVFEEVFTQNTDLYTLKKFRSKLGKKPWQVMVKPTPVDDHRGKTRHLFAVKRKQAPSYTLQIVRRRKLTKRQVTQAMANMTAYTAAEQKKFNVQVQKLCRSSLAVRLCAAKSEEEIAHAMQVLDKEENSGVDEEFENALGSDADSAASESDQGLDISAKNKGSPNKQVLLSKLFSRATSSLSTGKSPPTETRRASTGSNMGVPSSLGRLRRGASQSTICGDTIAADSEEDDDEGESEADDDAPPTDVKGYCKAVKIHLIFQKKSRGRNIRALRDHLKSCADSTPNFDYGVGWLKMCELLYKNYKKKKLSSAKPEEKFLNYPRSCVRVIALSVSRKLVKFQHFRTPSALRLHREDLCACRFSSIWFDDVQL